VAVINGHLDMARLLLRRGADVNARTKPQQDTVLHLACQSDSWKVNTTA